MIVDLEYRVYSRIMAYQLLSSFISDHMSRCIEGNGKTVFPFKIRVNSSLWKFVVHVEAESTNS